MKRLRDEMASFLKNWRHDVPAAWQPVLHDAQPDLDAVAPHLTLAQGETIFPLRKGHTNPGAPTGSHPFKALDGLAPDAVRAVLLGQDPYPKMRQATGRSFEQGDLVHWNGAVAESLRRIVQTLAQHRSPDPSYVAHDSAWPAVRARIDLGQPAVESPGTLFDRWQAAGVLCLNRALTLSRFDASGTPPSDQVQTAHMALWKPVIRRILAHLVMRPTGNLLVLLWGGKAQQGFDAMGIEAEAAAAGHADRLVVVRGPHPGADGPVNDRGASPFLSPPNPFTQANLALAAKQHPGIAW